ncbi:hypothetical protein HDR58_09935 [bacterium]|nr:hypothetical protein [bacterium]
MEKINFYTRVLIALRFLWNIFAPITLLFLTIIDVITEGFPGYIKYIYLMSLFMFILGIFFIFVTLKYLKNIDKSYFQLVYTIYNFVLFLFFIVIYWG